MWRNEKGRENGWVCYERGRGKWERGREKGLGIRKRKKDIMVKWLWLVVLITIKVVRIVVPDNWSWARFVEEETWAHNEVWTSKKLLSLFLGFPLSTSFPWVYFFWIRGRGKWILPCKKCGKWNTVRISVDVWFIAKWS